MIKIIILTFLFMNLLHAGTDQLPPHYRIDEKLTSELTKGSRDLDVKIYLSDDDFESALNLFESRGATLKDDIKEDRKEEREGLPGLKDLKGSFDQQGFGDLKNVTDYQRYSGRMGDGLFVVVASHYFDPEEKRWIKKTNVTLVRFLPDEETGVQPAVPEEITPPPPQTPPKAQTPEPSLQPTKPTPAPTKKPASSPVREVSPKTKSKWKHK